MSIGSEREGVCWKPAPSTPHLTSWFYREECLTDKLSCEVHDAKLGKRNAKPEPLINMIRTMLACSFVPLSFWHHALHMTTILLSILPCKTLQNKSPTQL
jgi:hypothetical protein